MEHQQGQQMQNNQVCITQKPQAVRIETHSKYNKLVMRDLRTGQYAKKH